MTVARNRPGWPRRNCCFAPEKWPIPRSPWVAGSTRDRWPLAGPVVEDGGLGLPRGQFAQRHLEAPAEGWYNSSKLLQLVVCVKRCTQIIQVLVTHLGTSVNIIQCIYHKLVLQLVLFSVFITHLYFSKLFNVFIWFYLNANSIAV